MKPLRISLKEYNLETFTSMLKSIIPLDDEERVKLFYQEMTDRYYHIILDITTGEVLQAFTKEGEWVLTKYYIDSLTTPEMLLDEKNGVSKEDKDREEILKAIEDAKNKVDAILDKISKYGEGAISRKEMKFLKENSHLI